MHFFGEKMPQLSLECGASARCHLRREKKKREKERKKKRKKKARTGSVFLNKHRKST